MIHLSGEEARWERGETSTAIEAPESMLRFDWASANPRLVKFSTSIFTQNSGGFEKNSSRIQK